MDFHRKLYDGHDQPNRRTVDAIPNGFDLTIRRDGAHALDMAEEDEYLRTIYGVWSRKRIPEAVIYRFSDENEMLKFKLRFVG